MNFMTLATNLSLLAGGSIEPNQRPLENAQIAGVTLAGLGIVFACLVILVFVIFLFGKIFDAINKAAKAKEAAETAKQAPKAAAVPKPAAAAAAAPAPAAVSDTDEDEVVAVIAAAIAAMGAADGKTYAVRSVRPAANGGFNGRSAWAMDGRRQNTMPF